MSLLGGKKGVKCGHCRGRGWWISEITGRKLRYPCYDCGGTGRL
jgi:DnaJ-class molecular chaperone